MEADLIDQCAQLLLGLRRDHRTVAALPMVLRPANEADAYAIQDRLHELGGHEAAALKVGCTGAAAQKALGFDAPFGARIAANTLVSSGSSVSLAMFHHTPFVEGEIAMRIGSDIASDTVIDRDRARSLIDGVAPAIELVDSRFDLPLGVDGLSLLADNGVAAALVIGEPLDPVDGLADLAAVVETRTATLATGSGAQVLGDPDLSLLWALQHEQRRGRGVRAGTWITTGTCTGLTPAPLDEEVTATFDVLGSVSVTINR